MSTTAGQMFGHFKLAEKVGEGGMGVVWRAVDTRLDREVALKTLPESFVDHPERLARFEREARALAALNHPNIAQIYGLERTNGDDAAPPVLVLEYVPGEGLDDRLDRGRLPVADALNFAHQIASGLEAAHELGIIHRDLKPGNLRITPDDRVKILDFGLAKVLAGDSAPGTDSATGVTESPTVTTDQTRVGAFLGTVGYMSPEQARGRPVDRRTDIWSFGCILFECLAGAAPFASGSMAEKIGAILHLEPPWNLLPAETPPAIADLLRHCLEKDPKARLRDIGDARLEIERTLAGDGQQRRHPHRRPGSRTVSFDLPPAWPGRAALVLVSLALGGLVLWNALGPGAFWVAAPTAARSARLSITLPRDLSLLGGRLVSEDAAVLLAAARRDDGRPDVEKAQLYHRGLGSFDLRPIPGTAGARGFLNSAGDGQMIYFLAPVEGAPRTRVLRVPADGSAPPVTVFDIDDKWSHATVLPGGDLLLCRDEGHSLERRTAGGTLAGPPMEIDSGDLKATVNKLHPLPGGRHALADAMWYTPQGFRLGVGVLDLTTAKFDLLLEEGGNAEYSPTGHLLFTRGDTLLAARFDLGKLALTGAPVALLGGLRTENPWTHGFFELRGRNLSFLPGGLLGRSRALGLATGDGREAKPWSGEVKPFVYTPRSSPDGRSVAMVVVTPNALYEIWVAGVEGREFRRLMASPDADMMEPVFAADGSQIAWFRLGKNEADGIYIRPVAGGTPRRVLAVDYPRHSFMPVSWSGAWMIVSKYEEGRANMQLLRVDAPGDGPDRLRPLLPAPATAVEAHFSPDGRFVAYVSLDSGRPELFVAPFLPGGQLGAGTQVPGGDWYHPRWSPDGRTLYFVDAQARAHSAALDRNGLPGAARALPVEFPRRAMARNEGTFAPLADGSLLYLMRGADEDEPGAVNVVLDLAGELERRVP